VCVKTLRSLLRTAQHHAAARLWLTLGRLNLGAAQPEALLPAHLLRGEPSWLNDPGQQSM